MKKTSIFSKVVLVVVLSIVCIVLTVGVALLAGASGVELFSLRNLNISNVVVILAVGIFMSCVIVGIALLFLARAVFLNLKEYHSKYKGENKK